MGSLLPSGGRNFSILSNRSSHQPLTVKRGPFLQVLKVQVNGGWVEVLRVITQMLLLHGSAAGAPALAQQPAQAENRTSLGALLLLTIVS